MLVKNVTSFETLQHFNPKIDVSMNLERRKQVSYTLWTLFQRTCALPQIYHAKIY